MATPIRRDLAGAAGTGGAYLVVAPPRVHNTEPREQLRARRDGNGRPDSGGSRGRFWPAVLDDGENGVFAEGPGLFISQEEHCHPRAASERGQPWLPLGGEGVETGAQALE